MIVQKTIGLAGLVILFLFHPIFAHRHVVANFPDLTIKTYEFVSTNNKQIRVQIANDGKATSKPCRLDLAIRKINGVAATRHEFETIPAIEPGKEAWVAINTSGILPSAVSLKDTTFRLVADETNIVTESNEDNNETWHNQN